MHLPDAKIQRQVFLEQSRAANKGTSGVQHLAGSTFSALARGPGDSAQVTDAGCYRDAVLSKCRAASPHLSADSQPFPTGPVAEIFPSFPERKNKPAFWREALLLVFTAGSHLSQEQSLLRTQQVQRAA